MGNPEKYHRDSFCFWWLLGISLTWVMDFIVTDCLGSQLFADMKGYLFVEGLHCWPREQQSKEIRKLKQEVECKQDVLVFAVICVPVFRNLLWLKVETSNIWICLKCLFLVWAQGWPNWCFTALARIYVFVLETRSFFLPGVWLFFPSVNHVASIWFIKGKNELTDLLLLWIGVEFDLCLCIYFKITRIF